MKPPYPNEAWRPPFGEGPEPSEGPEGRRYFTPGTFLLALFLLSLSMLFTAGLLGFIIVRMRPDAPPPGVVELPWLLWISTFVLITSSGTMHWGLRVIRRGRRDILARTMVVTTVLGFVFLGVQTPSLWALLKQHDRAMAQGIGIYGFMFFLVVLHAAHVIGGLIPMSVVTHHALRHRYHARRYAPVRHCAMYWHFLDIIWLTMFAVLLLTV